MNKALCTSGLIVAAMAAAGSAHAQSQPLPATILVDGFADQVCIVGAPEIDVTGATNIGQVSGNTVKIANLSDEQDFTTKATDFDIVLPAACNFLHRVVLSSDRGGLWRTTIGGAHAGFADGVPYLATLGWADLSSTLSAPAASLGEIDRSLDVDRPAFGDVTVHIRIDQGATNAGAGAPLVAGAYEDVLRVTVGPQ
jgi:hypothetical protein